MGLHEVEVRVWHTKSGDGNMIGCVHMQVEDVMKVAEYVTPPRKGGPGRIAVARCEKAELGE